MCACVRACVCVCALADDAYEELCTHVYIHARTMANYCVIDSASVLICVSMHLLGTLVTKYSTSDKVLY